MDNSSHLPVVAIFANRGMADSAIDALLHAGFLKSEIGLASPGEHLHEADTATEQLEELRGPRSQHRGSDRRCARGLCGDDRCRNDSRLRSRLARRFIAGESRWSGGRSSTRDVRGPLRGHGSEGKGCAVLCSGVPVGSNDRGRPIERPAGRSGEYLAQSRTEQRGSGGERADFGAVLICGRISTAALLPSPRYSGRGVGGEGRSGRTASGSSPHPRPLSPEYRGEGGIQPLSRCVVAVVFAGSTRRTCIAAIDKPILPDEVIEKRLPLCLP